MSGRRPEVVIVGAGPVGRAHARCAKASGGRVVDVVDADEALARQLAGEYRGARVFTDVEECLKTTTASVVHVCRYDEHAALADQALAAGRHAIVERPVSTTAEEARRLVDRATSLRLVLCPVHPMPFQRGFGRVLAQRDRLGDIVRIEASLCTAEAAGLDPESRREVLVRSLPHFVSLFRALVGPVSAVSWHVLASTSDDIALATRAATTQISLFATVRGRPERHELVVVGSARSARLDLTRGQGAWETGGLSETAKAAMRLARRAVRAEPPHPGLVTLIGAAYRAVRQGGPPPVPPEEIVEAAELIERVARSPRT
jgi:predicted dehydrogenase